MVSNRNFGSCGALIYSFASRLSRLPDSIIAVTISTKDRKVLSPDDGSLVEHRHFHSKPNEKS
jgi:hypothetical protein